MKNKRTLCVILALVLVFTAAGCSKSDGGSGTPANAQSNTQGNGSGAMAAQAQDMQKEVEQLMADMQKGKISPEEYQRRMKDLSTKFMGGLGASMPGNGSGQMEQQQQEAQQEQQRLEQEGDTAGWPPASVFAELGLKNIAPPAGISSRYTYHGNLYIWISKANASTLQKLKQNVEAALGTKLEGDNEGFGIGLDRSSIGSDGSTHGYILGIGAQLEYNVITFTFVLTN